MRYWESRFGGQTGQAVDDHRRGGAFQRHRSNGPSPLDLDVSDRSYFIAQRDRTVTVYS